MAFTEEQIQRVWEKGREVEGYDKDKYRQDACGAWIKKDMYGKCDSIFGWVIDHVFPLSRIPKSKIEIRNEIDNLRPMNCANNQSKGSDFPEYRSVIRAEGNKNVFCNGLYCVSVQLQEKLIRLYEGE